MPANCVAAKVILCGSRPASRFMFFFLSFYHFLSCVNDGRNVVDVNCFEVAVGVRIVVGVGVGVGANALQSSESDSVSDGPLDQV